MSDGTIEEDFEEALAREMEAGSISGSLRSPGKDLIFSVPFIKKPSPS